MLEEDFERKLFLFSPVIDYENYSGNDKWKCYGHYDQ
jgi:hypothetical protein